MVRTFPVKYTETSVDWYTFNKCFSTLTLSLTRTAIERERVNRIGKQAKYILLIVYVFVCVFARVFSA